MDGWEENTNMNKQMDGWMDRKNRWTVGWIEKNRCIKNELQDGQKKWMEKQMDGQKEG